MADVRLTKAAGDYARGFLTDSDGKHYRKETQELSHAIRRVEHIRHMHEYATSASNPNEWQHRGSIPWTLLIDWLNKHGYTIDQFARNDGGEPGKKYPNSRSGVRDKFLHHFFSRDYLKLHNMHYMTKRESSQILMPGETGGQLRRPENGNS